MSNKTATINDFNHTTNPSNNTIESFVIPTTTLPRPRQLSNDPR